MQTETKLADKAIDWSSAHQINEGPLGVCSFLSDDVDDTVDCIGPPDGATRPADDFDTFDVTQNEVLYVPIDSFKERRIDAPTVDQYQQIFGEAAIETANSDRPGPALAAGNNDAGDQAQDLRNAGGAGAANIVRGDDHDCCRGPPHFFRLFGDGCDFYFAELLQRERF